MTTVVERRARSGEAVLFICDFTPPRAADSALLEPVRGLDADFTSVAYNPGKTVRANSAFAASWIKEHTDKDVVFTLATRDMNKVAVQSLLLGAALWGLENVVIVKGDAFNERELAAVKAVDDFRPSELIASARGMNSGVDYKGGKLPSPTGLCIGATIDLGHEIEGEVALTRRKAESGAQFFLLQALFDPQRLQGFLDGYDRRYGEELSAPVFCGVQVMTADSMVFGDVPEWVREDLDKGRAGEEIAIDVLQRFVDRGFTSIYLIPPILRGGRRDYPAAQRVIETFRR